MENKAEAMQALIEEWQGSDQSKQDFCDARGITLSRFNYWLKKYGRTEVEPAGFRQVGFIPSGGSGVCRARVEIELAGGLIIRVY